jgi:F-type H+-transporting ATPase subunit gamma
MAKARALDKRRRSVRNIRKITRTMELIATARFKKAMDRANAATAYTKRITKLVADLSQAGLEVSHPLLEVREKTNRAILLVITGNRGLCGGYNSNAFRMAWARYNELKAVIPQVDLEISGKRGITAFKYRGLKGAQSYTHFEDKPSFAEVDVLSTRYLDEFITRKLDRLDVVYARFDSLSKQTTVVETLLPLASLTLPEASNVAVAKPSNDQKSTGEIQYEFLPSAASILEEVVPASFRVKLFKCFLDSAVSEQIARKVAMKSATDNADKLIKSLAMAYNRARQSQITGEIMEVLGGVEALKG